MNVPNKYHKDQAMLCINGGDLMQAISNNQSSINVFELTKREKEIARAMSIYFSMKRVARVLGLSLNTIKNHCTSIRLKLNEKEIYTAVMKAKLAGLLEGIGLKNFE